MLNIERLENETSVQLRLTGRLDTSTAPMLEKALVLDGVTELELDFTDVVYISSAGLRVLLMAQKAMNARGTMRVRNVCEEIMEVLEITGFTDILDIEA